MSIHSANMINENGEQFIPASQRPDGTWRKARRVKDGYIPQEEVPLYESKGKQFMNKKQNPITLPSGKVAERCIPGLYILQSDAKKKPSKKSKVGEITDKLQDVTISIKSKQNLKNKNSAKTQEPEQIDPAKKLKNLKKKLREVETLEEKIENGLLTNPEPEQLAKIKRKNELLFQINELERQLK